MKSGICAVLLVSLIGVGAQAAERRPGDVSYRTGPGRGAPVDLALGYLRENLAELGVSEADLADLVVSRVYASRGSGTTHVHFVQRHLGIEVWNGVVSVNVAADGSIMNVGNRLVKNLGAAVSGQQATLSAEDAVVQAAAGLGLRAPKGLVVIEAASGAGQATLLSGGGLTRSNIPAKLYYEPQAKGGPRLVWNVALDLADGSHWWNARVDAQTGELVAKNDWVVHDAWDGQEDQPGDRAQRDLSGTVRGPEPLPGQHAEPGPSHQSEPAPADLPSAGSYRVFQRPIESPNHGPRSLVANPENALASPFGWHDTNGAAGAEFTTTRGNNVYAYTDTDANNVPDFGSSPDGGASLVFDFALDLGLAPSSYRPAAVTNLFYWSNLMHDVSYLYGFDEASGNFQVNDYGRGGVGNDAVNAEAQDGGSSNNSHMTVPTDGQPPRMEMYLWTQTAPLRDADLDSGVIVHEYGHGISIRLTGDSVNCLTNPERMSEGWSDWQNLFMTMEPGDAGADLRGFATYVMGQPTTGVGIRPQPYTTTRSGAAGTFNDSTYQDTRTLAAPHGVGFVWASMLWELNWALIAKHGFNPDVYDTQNGGNNLAHRLVTEGMKLQPCNPGFVDGRDAILLADQSLTGGANQCEIWRAFASRGLGLQASQGSSATNSDNTEAFDLPQVCSFGGVTPASQDICGGVNAVYTVTVGTAFTSPPVDLSATGNPPPSTLLLSLDPVPTLPATSLMTIANTATVAAGNYIITVNGDDGVSSQDLTAGLRVFAAAPAGVAVLIAPALGASAVSTTPTLTWNAVSGATSYVVEVDDNPAFSSIDFTTSVSATSATATAGLRALSQYFWRVRAQNPCGAGASSSAFSYTTGTCVTPNLAIPDSQTVISTLTVPAGAANIADLDLKVQATHSWVGDLIVTLRHADTNRTVTTIDRPGVPASGFGCFADDIDVRLDDEGASGPVENQCSSPPLYAPPALFGAPTPQNPLSGFDGESLGGTWELAVSDAVTFDTPGVLQQWCLVVVPSDLIFADGFQ